MKQNVLILFALCLISLLFTGCSQNNVVHEDYISSDVLDLNSSEIVSSESEESENSSEENNQSEASTESTPPENHQQIIESSESSAKESIPENTILPPSNTQSVAPPQYNEPVEKTPPVEETPPITVTNEGSQVFQLVNQRRKENGLAELTYRNDIQDAANIRANEIISTFSHTRPDGSSCFTAVTVNCYAIGENIASGQKNAEEVMNAWMNSPGHRANILSAQFTGMAVGVVQYQGVSYWVQIFIG